jgi:hypothetical protein
MVGWLDSLKYSFGVFNFLDPSHILKDALGFFKMKLRKALCGKVLNYYFLILKFNPSSHQSPNLSIQLDTRQNIKQFIQLKNTL